MQGMPTPAPGQNTPPIVQYWDSGTPPADVADRLETFHDRNPDLNHCFFDERRAAELIVEHFGERELAAFRSCAVPSMRADYFRYCALLALGGIYADVGYRCAGSLRSLLEGAEGVLFRRDPPGYVLNGFFAFSRPGHPLLRLTLDVATVNIERRAVEMVQMVTGPWIFSSLWVLREIGAQRPKAGDDLARLAEPFRQKVATLTPTARGREGIASMVAPLFDAVGNYRRVDEAFMGVRVAPYEEMLDLVGEPEGQLSHKRSDDYWIRWQSQGRTIFR